MQRTGLGTDCLALHYYQEPMSDDRSEQEVVRFEKLKALQELGFAFPNDCKPNALVQTLETEPVTDPQQARRFILAGRIMQLRLMGKAAFVHIQDSSGRLQLYVTKDAIGEDAYSAFKKLDIGDIVEARGYLFITKTGEKTLHCESLRLLVKSLIPLPEKWHGLTDVEARYRQRYVDLIANPEVREVFRARARIIGEIRNFLNDRNFIEVQTPVLNSVTGGATARPFRTFFNALDVPMNLRIALELPLKKLVVGGLERVYEIGPVFRNEGLSRKHNPEFIMLEFYQAYATFHDLMDLTEELLVQLLTKIKGSLQLTYGEETIDFTPPWPRISMQASLHKYGGVPESLDLAKLENLVQLAKQHSIDLPEADDWGKCLECLWGELVEPKLRNPVFITQHPFSTSPLARKNDSNPLVTDRFELIIAGMEIANAFSELNDPLDQRERFEEQARRSVAGDEEAQPVETDFLRALEYGLPPTGGQGIGIDRLVMLLTNSTSIRDVLLFPQMRPEGIVG